MTPLQTIVAAALQHEGLTFSLPRPARHGDVIAALCNAGMPAAFGLDAEQGFLTSEGDFVTRKTPAVIAKLAGQIAAPQWGDELYSEDLW